MPRPAVIVGLGGTGQWVLTWLKRDLLLSNNGVMPDNVKLLEIDTATKLEAGAKNLAYEEKRLATGQKEEEASVGGVTLGPGEFVYVGGEARPLAEDIKNKKYPQMGWFRAERWLNDLPPTAFTLDDGAGRLRQFGRLAVFKDILGQETHSKIWRALRTAIEAVRTATDEERKLEVIVVGSFAGGTGSGLFIDIALILRMLAQQLGVHHVLRGFFALPSAFTSAPDSEMKARSFAAWRELNRFMVVNANFPMPKIQYVLDNESFQIRPDQRLFDACYLVDGRRDNKPIAAEAKYGVFPVIAESISAMLDEKAGTAYTQWIFTNLAPEYSKRPDIPMYSAIGAYTVQVPAYFVEKKSTHLHAQQILLKLLSPKVEPDQFGYFTSRGALRHLELAAPDKNMEDKGFAGRKRSRRLLREKITYQGSQASPLMFTARIADIVEKCTESGTQQAQVIEQLARAGSVDPKAVAAAASWLSVFPNFGDDSAFEAIRKEVNYLMGYSVIQSYKRRDKEKEDETRLRFKKISDDLRQKFGGKTATGEEKDEFYGACGDTLEKCADTQASVFIKIVRLYLLDILMGRDENPIVAKSGKLGYAWDFFDGLVKEFGDFLEIMDKVRHRREEIKPELQMQGMSDRAKRYLDSVSGKKIFWLWEHPNIKGAEDAYLQAQQRNVDLRREDILHVFVRQTAVKMQAICTEARDILQHWIWHLTTGDDASGLPGLWDGVRNSLLEIENAQAYDRKFPLSEMVADKPLDASDDEIAKALSQWQWQVEVNQSAGVSISAQVLPASQDMPQVNLGDPALLDTSAKRIDASLSNQSALMELARRDFIGFAFRTTVAEEIKRVYPKPDDFANKVVKSKAEPLFYGSSNASSRKRSNLIRVKSQDNDPYFVGDDKSRSESLVGLLRKRENLDANQMDDGYSIQVVGSENPYKLTIVRTDDLYQYDNFGAWDECRIEYEKHFSDVGHKLDPSLMHIFPAEALAAKFERDDFRKTHIYRELHPQVVMLLEDPTALEQFLYLYAMGKVDDVEINGSYRWELKLKDGAEGVVWLTPNWNETEHKAARPKPSLLNAVHGFVVLKQNQSPNSHLPIDSAFAHRVIEETMAEMKKSVDGYSDIEYEVKWIEHQIGEDGIVGTIRKQAPDPDDGHERKEYVDLARVAEMKLLERKKDLESKLKGTNKPKPFVAPAKPASS